MKFVETATLFFKGFLCGTSLYGLCICPIFLVKGLVLLWMPATSFLRMFWPLYSLIGCVIGAVMSKAYVGYEKGPPLCSMDSTALSEAESTPQFFQCKPCSWSFIRLHCPWIHVLLSKVLLAKPCNVCVVTVNLFTARAIIHDSVQKQSNARSFFPLCLSQI